MLQSEVVVADDPLHAFPTAEHSAEERVKGLTDQQRRSIRRATEVDKVAFQITVMPWTEEKPDEETTWLKVFADGRMTGRSRLPRNGVKCEDTLSKAELDWLLHLAVNECKIPKLSTAAVNADYQKRGGGGELGKIDRTVMRYDLELEKINADFSLPEAAIITRPLRKKMGLEAFASLHKYVHFLVSRAYVGDSTERRDVLSLVNTNLRAKIPEAPSFQIEHLASASVIDDVPVTTFQQEIELAANHFKRISATVLRKDGVEPTVTIQDFEFHRQ